MSSPTEAEDEKVAISNSTFKTVASNLVAIHHMWR